MEFIEYSPAWLVQIITDGLLAVVFVTPSIVGLVVYAWFCFSLVDAILGAINDLVIKRVARNVASSSSPIGSVSSRSRLWLGRVFSLLLKAWVGLPAFYLLNLSMSSEKQATAELIGFSSGYSWQRSAALKLPAGELPFSEHFASIEPYIDVVIILLFFLFIFIYWSRGFDVVRRIRFIGDNLLRIVRLPNDNNPSIQQAILSLRRIGWSPKSCEAAYWFLMLINLRLAMTIGEYGIVTPAAYGAFKVLKSLTITAGLTLLHPIVAGIYLSTLVKDIGKTNSTIMLYKQKLNELPTAFKESVGSQFPTKI